MLAAMVLFSACGGHSESDLPSISAEQAPARSVAPRKVDILLAEDNSGSIAEIYSTVAQQMPGFLLRLDATGWDYHFATIPLVSDRPFDQVVASRYDANWGTEWKAPYPGATPDAAESVSPGVFRRLLDYSGFMTRADVTNSSNGVEWGFENIRAALYERAKNTGFLRENALLVLVVVSNGDDTSGVADCTRSDGVTVPCERAGSEFTQYGTQKISFDYYKAQFQGLKSSRSQVRMFSLVPGADTRNCLGATARTGSRYQEMSRALGGKWFDLCSKPLSAVLSSLSESLAAQ